MDRFARARQVADAVLYEGYVLYPYRATSAKNQLRWQFGVLVPGAWRATGEHAWLETECLLQPGELPALRGAVRCLRLQRRTVEDAAGRAVARLEVDGQLFVPWDEGVEHEVPFSVALEPGSEEVVRFALDGTRCEEPLPAGRIVRQTWPIRGELRIQVTAVDVGLLKLRVRVENTTPWPEPESSRDEALRSSLLGVHTLLAVEDGAFVSLLEPPAWASAAAAACVNVRTWPVLVGEDVMLSSPIILYDHPAIAPQSPADLCDATEIDEILTLRAMTLTDGEKREARATDPRAAAIVDGADALSEPQRAALHGSASRFAVGQEVRLRPGIRRTDAQDMFLVGRLAVIRAVMHDAEGKLYLAVTLVDDPAADLRLAQRRFHYFHADEVE